jgi:hypothetical protein
MNDILYKLKRSFDRDFSEWLAGSNNSDIRNLQVHPTSINQIELNHIVNQSLSEILQVLVDNKEANHFWYNWKGNLTWSLPTDQVAPSADQVAPSDSICIEYEKVVSILRDWKISKVLECQTMLCVIILNLCIITSYYFPLYFLI